MTLFCNDNFVYYLVDIKNRKNKMFLPSYTNDFLYFYDFSGNVCNSFRSHNNGYYYVCCW